MQISLHKYGVRNLRPLACSLTPGAGCRGWGLALHHVFMRHARGVNPAPGSGRLLDRAAFTQAVGEVGLYENTDDFDAVTQEDVSQEFAQSSHVADAPAPRAESADASQRRAEWLTEEGADARASVLEMAQAGMESGGGNLHEEAARAGSEAGDREGGGGTRTPSCTGVQGPT